MATKEADPESLGEVEDSFALSPSAISGEEQEVMEQGLRSDSIVQSEEKDSNRRNLSIGAIAEELQDRIGRLNGEENNRDKESSGASHPQPEAGDRSRRAEDTVISKGARDRPLPQDDFLIYDRLTRESTLAQDTLGFDYVRGDGVIVDGDEYIGLVEVHPRNWLVLNDAERTAVFRAYTSFLMGLKYPIQIVALPREFDINKHTDKIRIADSQARRNAESPILRHGRRRHVAWMHNTIDRLSVKDRDFYIAVRVHSSHVNPVTIDDNPFRRLPLVGSVIAGLITISPSLRPGRRRDIETQNEERCVQEIRARQNELSETLTKTGVRTRIVSDRDETMDVLYRHFNHVESPFSTYNHATYTKLLSNALSRDGE